MSHAPQGGQAPDQASSGRQTGAAVPPGQIIPKAHPTAASHLTSHKQHGDTRLASVPDGHLPSLTDARQGTPLAPPGVTIAYVGRKLFLGLSAALVLGLWAFCAVVYVVRSRTGSYDGSVIWPFVSFAASSTVVATGHQTLARRGEARMVAAALTSVGAAVAVFVLLLVLLVPGG